VGLEWGPLSLVSIAEELLGRKSSCSGLETEFTAVRDQWLMTSVYLKISVVKPKEGKTKWSNL
jgi:hypothetical protein